MGVLQVGEGSHLPQLTLSAVMFNAGGFWFPGGADQSRVGSTEQGGRLSF